MENNANVIWRFGCNGEIVGVQITFPLPVSRGVKNFLETMKEQPTLVAETVSSREVSLRIS